MTFATLGLAPATLPTEANGFPPIPEHVDVLSVAKTFTTALSDAVTSNDAEAFAALFTPGGFWRDVLAFTNDYRCVTGDDLLQAAKHTFPLNQATNFAIASVPAPVLEKPFPDLAFIRVHLTFTTPLGTGEAVARLVPSANGWVAWTFATTLTNVHSHPPMIGTDRPAGEQNDTLPYDAKRVLTASYPDGDPDILVIGAGHNGLTVAAQARVRGLKALVLDKEARVGDNWRLRYASLSLHDPVHTNHLPFMSFPKTWPTFTPAGKLANWLENYVDTLELDVWVKSTLDPSKSVWNEDKKRWDVVVVRTEADGTVTERPMSVSHIVLATGLAGGAPFIPPAKPGQDTFEGRIVHSSEHGGAAGCKGVRTLVVGACTSAHDVSLDLVKNGATVTMLQRSPTYIMSIEHGKIAIQGGIFDENMISVEVADAIAGSVPRPVAKLFAQRSTAWLASMDKDLLEGLEKAGFKTSSGIEGTGAMFLAAKKAGGYYFDTGCSPYIVDGTIKVQQGEIASFGPGKTVTFADGNKGQYDLVIFSTGYTGNGYAQQVAATLGDKWAQKLHTVFGLDAEGEVMGIGRDCGIPNVMFNVGNLSSSRGFSRSIILTVLAQREGNFGERYTMAKQHANGA